MKLRKSKCFGEVPSNVFRKVGRLELVVSRYVNGTEIQEGGRRGTFSIWKDPRADLEFAQDVLASMTVREAQRRFSEQKVVSRSRWRIAKAGRKLPTRVGK